MARNKVKQKTLIVDDSEMNRSILADMLGDEFDILEAANGIEAINILQKSHNEISLVLLDIIMPEMDGFEVLAVMNRYHWIDSVPVIMISAENNPSAIERAYELGVTDYISRPFDVLIVRRRAINTIMLYAKQKKLTGLVADQIYEKERTTSLMVYILSHIVEFRNGESGLHVLRINTLTELLLDSLVSKTDKYHLSKSDISLITMASSLHDIGKISIDSQILNKPGRLTPEEFEIMKTHSTIGDTMLKELPFMNEPLVKVAREICRWHHERYDGRGYPDGLKGEEIPISAQVVSLADVYDALTSKRVYKDAFPHKVAMGMINDGKCGAFNPILLDCLNEIQDSISEEIKVNFFDTKTNDKLRNTTSELLNNEELSASERTLQLLEQERAKYQFFASVTQEIQFEYTADPPLLSVSEWGVKRLGVEAIVPNPYTDKQLLKIINGTDMIAIAKALRETTPDNAIVQHECQLMVDGCPRWYRIICQSTWSVDEPPICTGAIGKAVDIHDERAKMNHLTYMAYYDTLTGLMNRGYARNVISKKLADQPEGKYALAVLDIDSFKNANDKYGHVFGDQVLQQAAERLKQNMRSDDIAARIGGDEFLIFLECGNDGIENVIKRIFYAVTGAYKGFYITVSMGVALSGKNCCTLSELYRRADTALYSVKNKTKDNYCFYEPSMKSIAFPDDKEGFLNQGE